MGRKDSMDSLDGRDSIDLTSVIAEFPHNDDYPHQIPVKKLIETFESCAAANLNSTTGSTASSSAASSDGGMKVYLRIRPTKTPESTITVENEFSIVTTAPECSKRALYTKTESRHYIFSRVFDQHSQQTEVFEHTTLPLMNKFLSGDNCVIFAYGMTNAGKTHTIQGTHTQPGILPRLVSTVMDHPDFQSNWELHASMFEIYQENIYDLLGKRREKLNIRDCNGKVEVAKLSYHLISSTQDAFKLMDTAASKRTKSSTFLNTGSSRSHAVYNLTLSRPSADGKEFICSQLQLVDLAGAERSSRTKANNAQQKEANNINMSLMQLWRCLQAVKRKNTDLNGSMEVIPFRESKLTHLLMPILSRAGMSGVAMIACVNPQVDDYDETLSILGNASLASKIREFHDVGRIASQQIPVSTTQLAATAAAAPAAAGGSTKGGIKLEELKDYKDKNPAPAAGKRKRQDSTLATTATAAAAAGRATRKNSVVAGLKSARETQSVEAPPVVAAEKEANDDEEGEPESERKRLRLEVENLREENSQLIQATITREAEIRAEVSQEMITRSSHMLHQIQELRQKLSHYEMQQVNDVTKSCRKVRKQQILAAQENVADDLQEAEDELIRVKTEYEITVHKLQTENQRLREDLASVRQKLAAYEIQSGPSRLQKVLSVKKTAPSSSSPLANQENVVVPNQESASRFQRENSGKPFTNNNSENIVFLGELKKSPSRSPLSQLSSSNINTMGGSNSPSRSNSPLKHANSNSPIGPQVNTSPVKLRSGGVEQASVNSASNSGSVPYFKRLRSHFARA